LRVVGDGLAGDHESVLVGVDHGLDAVAEGELCRIRATWVFAVASLT
jgi:hypothetical protein